MLLLLLACTSPPDGKSPPSPEETENPGDSHSTPTEDTQDTDTGSTSYPRNVILLVLDGVRVEEFSSTTSSDLTGVTGEAWCPNFWRDLASEGTMIRKIHNPGLTATAPAHVALFTGRSEPYDNISLENGVSSLYYPEVPTIWGQAAAAGLTAHFLGNAGLLFQTTQSLYPDAFLEEEYETVGGGADLGVFEGLLAQIADDHPRLLVANLHNVDAEGHLGPDGSYASTIQTLDQNISDFWKELKTKEPDYLANTLLIVTTDHGRHRVDPSSAVPWQTHGDGCAGCRELPLLLLGPGIPAATEVERDLTSQDISSLMAAWLDLDLPFAGGLPLDDLVPGLETPVREGEIGVSAVGGHVAVQRWEGEESHRSSVWVDGEMVSSPDALAAEAPVLAEDADHLWVCWRELQDQGTVLPWVPRCLQKNGVEPWVDIGFAAAEVNSVWEPDLTVNQGVLWVSWADQEMAIGYWDGSTWQNMGESATFALHTSMAVTTDHLAVTWAEGERLTRDITLLLDGKGIPMQFGNLLTAGLHRVERSAVRMEGSLIQVAALLIGENQRFVVLKSSADVGKNWSQTEVLPGNDPFLPNVSPQWVGNRLYWAVLLEDGTAGICGILPGEGAPHCVSMGTPYLDSFAVDTEIFASVRSAPGVWETVRRPIP